MKCRSYYIYAILLSTLIGLNVKTLAQSGSCDPSTPFHTVDLSSDPAGTWISPLESRDGQYCTANWPAVCVEFEITLHPNAAGLNFEIVEGAAPSGSLFYQIDCGPEIPVGDPICLADPGPHTLTFCKPGNNPNAYQITSIPAAITSPQDTVKPGCIAELVYTGFGLYEDSITWNDITSGTGYYNSFLDCTSGCDTVYFDAPPTTTDPYVDFQVCGVPNTGICDGFFSSICDTFRVYIIPPVEVEIDPFPQVLCTDDTSLTLYATLVNPLPGILYQWFDGPDGSGSSLGFGDSLVITSPGTVSVIALDTNWPDCSRDTATTTVVGSPPINLSLSPDQSICQGESISLSVSGADTYLWSPGTGLDCTNCANVVASPSSSTVYTVVGINSLGCDATDSVQIIVNSSYSQNIDLEMCDGDSILIAGVWQSTAGVYTETLTSSGGCDSIFIIDLSVLPNSSTDIEYSICDGDSVLLPNGIWANMAGTWTDTISSTGSCQVLINYVVTELSNIEILRFENICSTDSFFLPGGYWASAAGTYSDTLASASGCDSVIQTVLQVFPAYLADVSFQICPGDSVFLA